MNNFDAIIFIGPQGSGKGTQATILAKKIGAEYVEMGALLRHVAKEDNEFGRHIKELMTAGHLLEDADLISVIKTRLNNLNPEVQVIFDGVPRRIKQAEYLLNYLRENNRDQIATIYISIPRNLTIERLQKRLVCVNCEHPEIADKNNSNQVCSVCEGSLMHRHDDTTEAINRRLDLFEQETLPVVSLLEHDTKLFKVDGSEAIQVVTEQIFEKLGLEVDEDTFVGHEHLLGH